MHYSPRIWQKRGPLPIVPSPSSSLQVGTPRPRASGVGSAGVAGLGAFRGPIMVFPTLTMAQWQVPRPGNLKWRDVMPLGSHWAVQRPAGGGSVRVDPVGSAP